MIKYTRMMPEHVEQIANLETMCFSAPWSNNAIAGELLNPLSLWVVAIDRDRIVGYVGSQTVLGEADIMNIAVDPNYRRRGIACKLIDKLVALLKENQTYSLTLEVRASNYPAIALYQRLDFFQVGRRPNYYRDPKEDALILRKEWQL